MKCFQISIKAQMNTAMKVNSATANSATLMRIVKKVSLIVNSATANSANKN
jgi:hypothetical protein